MSKTLVTTALESTWPKDGPILFLGTWCCSFARQDFWSSLDSEVLAYHWDDRDKLSKDYNELEIFYEEFLSILSNKLNEIHGTEFPTRFWRILIGPWLYTSIQIVFDRWYMLKKAIRREKFMNILSLSDSATALITNDMGAFNNAIEKDVWNEALYSFLIVNFFHSEVSLKYVKNVDEAEVYEKRSKTRGLKSRISKICNVLSRISSREKDVFIISPHMSFIKQTLLHFKLRQFPTFWFKQGQEPIYKYDLHLRKKTKICCEVSVLSELAPVMNKVLFFLMPMIYLEGFQSLLNTSNNQGWPKKPKAIFTSNSYAFDDQFKCWAGKQVINGSKLIIGQHGGNFGMSKISIDQTHQTKIADKWLSWGWISDVNPAVVRVGNFKSSFKRIKRLSRGDALLVSMTLPKFSYYLYSVPIAGQVGKYLDDQLEFAKALPDHIKQRLRVRLYPLDRDWDQKNRWLACNKKISFDNSNKSLIKSFRSSRVFIGTYNATTYLEAFAVNMPSILFWNPSHWEVNTETAIYFNRLKSVKILHESPKSAATHLANIWDNIDEWWFGRDVQETVDDFINCYSMRNPQLLNSIAKHLNCKQ